MRMAALCAAGAPSTSGLAAARARETRKGLAEPLGLLRLLAALDDVALAEENRLQRDAPLRRSPQQELEVHAEVLELLGLGVLHDRPGLRVGLERHPLLVPADRLGLLGERRDHAGERPRLGAQLLGGLVVLLESHSRLLSAGPWPGDDRSARDAAQ